MRALAYLLGARSIDTAAQRLRQPRRGTEPDLPALAGTPDQARAWRRWAEAGRMEQVAAAAPLAASMADARIAAARRGAA